MYPVSYTHLDVYKRQPMGLGLRKSNNRSSILMLPPRPIIDLADDIDLTDEEQDESSEREDA